MFISPFFSLDVPQIPVLFQLVKIHTWYHAKLLRVSPVPAL